MVHTWMTQGSHNLYRFKKVDEKRRSLGRVENKKPDVETSGVLG